MKEKAAKSQSQSKKPRLISYRIRKSPYFEATERYGCRAYTTYNNMYLPLVYQDLVSDYWHIKKGVTIWDVGCQRQVEITGPDAFKFLQHLTPRNLDELQRWPMQICCSHQRKMVAFSMTLWPCV